jgi:hypothetical protein
MKFWIWTLSASLVCTLPFLNKAFHIDDTFVLHVARSILQDPLRPFAGDIDWFGYLGPVWEATTNPPLLSYYLAPFAWISDFSEPILHAAMIPFYWALAAGAWMLAARFGGSPPMAVLLLMSSGAVVVSGNVMRDVPGAGLAVLGLALFVRGVDEDSRGKAVGGALLCGLAATTKYSMGLSFVLLAAYLVLERKGRRWPLAVPAAFPMALWAFQNWWIEGRIHFIYLFFERRTDTGIAWEEMAFGLLCIVGSLLFGSLLLLWKGVREGRWAGAAGSLLAAAAVAFAGFAYYERWDSEFSIWAGLGAAQLLLLALWAPPRDRDSAFLWIWVVGVLAFSIWMVPFQAVRHLIFAFPVMILLLLQAVRAGRRPFAVSGMVGVAAAQFGLAVLMQWADMDYAGSYREFAGEVASVELEAGREIWYVGTWGWKFYADRAGFRQLHRDGPDPESGDLILWPSKVYVGQAWAEKSRVRERLELVESRRVDSRLPLRVMDGPERAGFYAVLRQRIPVRFFPDSPIEEFRIFRVGEAEAN